MDQETQQESKLMAWLEPQKLLGLIHDLRAAEYRIGVQHYAACQKVVVSTLAQGRAFEKPQQLESRIRPILCSTWEEQENFGIYFSRWLKRMNAFPKPKDPFTEVEKKHCKGPSAPPQLTRASRFLVAFLITAMLGLSVFWIAQSVGKPSLEENGRSWQQTLAPFAFIAALAAAFALLQKFRRSHLFLLRRFTRLRPATQSFVLKKRPHREVFSGMPVHQVAQAFRLRGIAPSADLDVDASVEATVKKAGWFQPCFAKRRVVPEYLALIDRKNFRDQKARIIEEMLDYLRQDEVFIKKYYFVHDPRLCFPAKDSQNERAGPECREFRLADSWRESPTSLAELQSRFPEHRLLIFSEAETFFSPVTGELESWVEGFKHWSERALFLSLRPPLYQLKKLRQCFSVLPSDGQGLEAMAKMVQGLAEPAEDLLENLSELPTDLAHYPLEWLDERPPPLLADSSSLPTPLAGYLKAPGLLWLRACAVYPELDWNLTQHLGRNLPGAYHPQVLHRLISLPWLRHGYMPDWLREVLIAGMSKLQKLHVREVLNDLLSDVRLTKEDRAGKGFELQVASVSGFFATLKTFLSKPKARPDSPLRDYVFLRFMSSKLAFPLPSNAARELGKKPLWELETFADPPILLRVQRFSWWLLTAIVLGYLVTPVVSITLHGEAAAAFLLVLLGVPLSMIALSSYDNRLLWVGTINATFMILAAFLFPIVGDQPFHLLLAIGPVWMSVIFFHVISEKEIVDKNILYHRLKAFLVLPLVLCLVCLTSSPSLKLMLLMVASLGILLIVYGFFRNVSSVAWLGLAYFASLPLWSHQYFSSSGPWAATWLMPLYCLGLVPLMLRAWRHWR